MKKIANIILATIIGLTMVMKPVSVNASSESGDLSLEDKYYQILASRFAKAPLFSNNIGESKLYSSDFSVFNSIVTKPSAELIAENRNTGEAIIHDTNNDLLIYADIIDDSQMTMIVEGNKYTIIADENDIYCISQYGESLKVMEYTPDIPSTESLNKSEAIVASSGSWILMAQHIKGTNTLLLQAISEIATIGGTISWLCSNSLFGAIFNILGVFSYVGQKMTVTLYTDYDRYYKSDCTTYFKDYVRFYQYNNYTGYVGAGNSYFHSVRPDYAGQNCMAYA
ncbi:hypothetical protein MOZ60_10040 [Stecheria sp. CLA-KB-P133]|uniref:Uncharacterized protein n=1 Tax=Grylomicrobium aquisgranensis TaxID=2926318 RepID=A0AB35U6E3_9FIRM|nr:hypothetical protein [Stecheria sp. CLA-KB-P133]